MRALRGFYFLYYGSVAALLSYFAPYLRGLGFSGAEIGAAFAPAQMVMGPAALLWGGAADKLGAASRALRLCTAGAFCCMAFVLVARTPLQIGALLFAHSLFNAGTVPLADSITMEAAQARGESYARTRLWGSVGFVLVAQALGVWLSMRGERKADGLVPASMVLLVGAMALAALFVPRLPAHPSRPRLRDAAALLRGPLPLLLALCTLHWASLAPYHLLFGVLLRDLGQPAQLTGAGMALGVLAEVGALLVYPMLALRMSLRSLLAIAFAASAARWLLLSRASSPVELVGLQLLHAASFGLWWGAAVQAMGEIVPAPLRSTGQALFSALVFGLGNSAGYALAGAGYDHFHSAGPLFAVAGGVELFGLVLVLLFGKAVESRKPKVES